MEQTSGFYKLENDEILFGPNFVESPTYMLHRENYEVHDYPVDGWYWFGSRLDAYNFFGKPLPEEA